MSLSSRLVPVTSLQATYQKAVQAAITARVNGYAPYSNFLVGAALVHPDGAITPGCNYETSVYQGTCAERTAMVTANCAGRRQAVAIAVFGAPADPANVVNAICTPCGVCRQFLMEVSQLSQVDIDIIMVNSSGDQAAISKLSELLPHAFGPNDLGLDLSKWSKGANDP